MLTWDEEVTPLSPNFSERVAPQATPPALPTLHVSTAPMQPASTPASLRACATDRRIINGKTNANQLVPFKYKWAWDQYLAGCTIHWMQQEVNMTRDIAPECRQFLLHQAFEKTIHTHVCQCIVESLGLHESEFFNIHDEVPSIRAKDESLIPFIDVIMNPSFDTGTPETDQAPLKSVTGFACLLEGLFFCVGFAQCPALRRQSKMTSAAEQYQYTLHDESMDCNFAIDLVNATKHENSHLWTAAFEEEIKALFPEAVELECHYAEDTMPRGVIGMNASMFKGYLRHIGNRRASQIGLGDLVPQEENPFPWMSEMIVLKKERNLFETDGIEYQSGCTLAWEKSLVCHPSLQ